MKKSASPVISSGRYFANTESQERGFSMLIEKPNEELPPDIIVHEIEKPDGFGDLFGKEFICDGC